MMFGLNTTLADLDLSNIITQLLELPDLHFPSSKSKPYVQLRNSISAKYGILTTIFMMAVILLLPVITWLNTRYLFRCFGSRFFTRQKYLRKISQNFFYHYTTIKTIVFWGIGLSLLSFLELNHDLIFLGKRLGRVCTVSLTTVLFLSLRPSPLPKILYLSLLPIHKWLSRIIILQAAGHTLIYLSYFNHKKTWSKAYKLENIYGIIAMFAFLVIFFTSIFKMRRWSYKIFYINHYIWTWIIVITLQFHARPGIGPYTIMNGLILLYQIFYRWSHTKVTDVNVINISPNLTIVNIPIESLANTPLVPGAHLRLAEYKSNYISRFLLNLAPLYHPYTIASLPTDKVQKLIVRKTTFKFSNKKKYSVIGSFEPMLPFMKPKPISNLWSRLNHHTENNKSLFQSLPFIKKTSQFNINMDILAKKVLIVVGGSAISFALPVLRVMNYNGIPCKLIWVIRDLRDVKVLKFFSAAGDCVDVYVTGNYETTPKSTGPSSSLVGNAINKYGSTNDTGYFDHDLENGLDFNVLENAKDTDSNNEDENENVEVDYTDDCDFKDSTDGLYSGEEINLNTNIFSHANNTLEIVYSNDIDDNEENYNDRSIMTIGDILSPKDSLSISSDEHQHDIKLKHAASTGTDGLQLPHAVKHHLSSMQSRNEIFSGIPSSIKSYVPLGVTIYKGRPKLGGTLYDWCSDQSCVGPVEINGSAVCCRDFRKKSNSNLQSLMGAGSLEHEEYLTNKFKSNVWVVGAGPSGLVQNVSAWAKDNGFHFHAESFSV